MVLQKKIKNIMNGACEQGGCFKENRNKNETYLESERVY